MSLNDISKSNVPQPSTPISPAQEAAHQNLQAVAKEKGFNRYLIVSENGKLEQTNFFKAKWEGFIGLFKKNNLRDTHLIKLKALQLVVALGKEWTNTPSEIALVKALAVRSGLTEDPNLNFVIDTVAESVLKQDPSETDLSLAEGTTLLNKAFAGALDEYKFTHQQELERYPDDILKMQTIHQRIFLKPPEDELAETGYKKVRDEEGGEDTFSPDRNEGGTTPQDDGELANKEQRAPHPLMAKEGTGRDIEFATSQTVTPLEPKKIEVITPRLQSRWASIPRAIKIFGAAALALAGIAAYRASGTTAPSQPTSPSVANSSPSVSPPPTTKAPSIPTQNPPTTLSEHQIGPIWNQGAWDRMQAEKNKPQDAPTLSNLADSLKQSSQEKPAGQEQLKVPTYAPTTQPTLPQNQGRTPQGILTRIDGLKMAFLAAAATGFGLWMISKAKGAVLPDISSKVLPDISSKVLPDISSNLLEMELRRDLVGIAMKTGGVGENENPRLKQMADIHMERLKGEKQKQLDLDELLKGSQLPQAMVQVIDRFGMLLNTAIPVDYKIALLEWAQQAANQGVDLRALYNSCLRSDPNDKSLVGASLRDLVRSLLSDKIALNEDVGTALENFSYWLHARIPVLDSPDSNLPILPGYPGMEIFQDSFNQLDTVAVAQSIAKFVELPTQDKELYEGGFLFDPVQNVYVKSEWKKDDYNFVLNGQWALKESDGVKYGTPFEITFQRKDTPYKTVSEDIQFVKNTDWVKWTLECVCAEKPSHMVKVIIDAQRKLLGFEPASVDDGSVPVDKVVKEPQHLGASFAGLNHDGGADGLDFKEEFPVSLDGRPIWRIDDSAPSSSPLQPGSRPSFGASSSPGGSSSTSLTPGGVSPLASDLDEQALAAREIQSQLTAWDNSQEALDRYLGFVNANPSINLDSREFRLLTLKAVAFGGPHIFDRLPMNFMNNRFLISLMMAGVTHYKCRKNIPAPESFDGFKTMVWKWVSHPDNISMNPLCKEMQKLFEESSDVNVKIFCRAYVICMYSLGTDVEGWGGLVDENNLKIQRKVDNYVWAEEMKRQWKNWKDDEASVNSLLDLLKNIETEGLREAGLDGQKLISAAIAYKGPGLISQFPERFANSKAMWEYVIAGILQHQKVTSDELTLQELKDKIQTALNNNDSPIANAVRDNEDYIAKRFPYKDQDKKKFNLHDLDSES